jgi:hypothetical protein
MPARIDITNVVDRDEERSVRASIEKVFVEKQRDWHVSIWCDQQNGIWTLSVDGPNSYRWERDLIGEDGEQEPKFIANAIESALLEAAFE